MGRPPCCDKANVKRGLWTAEEDAKILAYVSAHGTGNWTLVPKKAGLNRCGKSCRLRWTNYLRPDLKHESFSPEEEQLIINFHQVIGSRWSLIAKQLPGRTDNDVKNYWNTKLRKKLVKMGIDPVTHKPISQILSDYENISSIPNPTSHFPGSSSIATLNTTLLPQSPSPVFQTPSYSNLISNASTMTEEVDESFCDLASWNLLGQHQLIHHEALQHHFYNDIPSSCSSSSSPATAQLGSLKPGSFQPSQAHRSAFPQSSPHGVLSHGQLLPRNFMQNQESGFGGSLLCTNSSRSKENECNFTNVSGFDGDGVGDERLMNPCSLPQFPCKASSSTGNAFVDALLDRDSQIQSEFGELLDGILDY